VRLDRALAARGLARSRTHAQALLESGCVRVDGVEVVRPATDVTDKQTITLNETGDFHVSRGALKLLGALDAFSRGDRPGNRLAVEGRRCLDAGASTGGFTQVLLEHGAVSVLALDVGHGQMSLRVAADPRVTSREGVNVRYLDPPEPGQAVDLIVADLSFISLTLVIDPLASWLVTGGDAVVLVKPQFEVGAARLGKGGVVRNDAVRIDAVSRVAAAMAESGLPILGVARSPVSGADGNVEIFLWGRKTWQAKDDALSATALIEAIEREVKGAT